jgi:hypothetical protein
VNDMDLIWVGEKGNIFANGAGHVGRQIAQVICPSGKSVGLSAGASRPVASPA